MLLNIGAIGGRCIKSVGKTKFQRRFLKRIGEKEPRFYREIARLKLAYVGHLRGSGGRNALVILEGKLRAKKQKVD